MQKIELNDATELLDSPLIGLLVGRFYITVRHRNAWHATTSSRYQGETSLNLAIGESRAVAERWRKQGSQFLIREVPGVVLLTPEGLAATVDFHHDNAFSYWDVKTGKKHLERGTPLRHAVRSLGARGDWSVRPNPHSIVQGAEHFATIDPVGEKASFSNHVSFAQGAQYTLGWRSAQQTAVTARGAHRVRRAFLAVNGPESVKAGAEEYLAEKERRQIELFARIRARSEARKARQAT